MMKWAWCPSHKLVESSATENVFASLDGFFSRPELTVFVLSVVAFTTNANAKTDDSMTVNSRREKPLSGL